MAPRSPAGGPRPVPRILSTRLEGEAVLLDPERGRYFTLNEQGARVWDLLGEGRSLEEVHAVLLAEYEVEPERLSRDLEELVRRLAEEGLVEGPPRPGGER